MSYGKARLSSLGFEKPGAKSLLMKDTELQVKAIPFCSLLFRPFRRR